MLYLFFGLIGGVVVVDLLSKFIMSNVLFVKIIPDIFSFSYTQNSGVAFSIGADNPAIVRIMVSVLAVMVATVGIILFIKYKNKSKLLAVGSALFIGGTIGNLFDRIFLGYVRDFICLEFAGNTSNLADLGITVGCVLLGVWYIWGDKRKKM